jgi:predicted deacetylase
MATVPDPDLMAAWLPRSMVQQAKTIASRRRLTITEVLARHLRQSSLEVEFQEVVSEINAESTPPRRKEKARG